MKIENQVCSFEQAKQLNKLGVTANALFNYSEHVKGFAIFCNSFDRLLGGIESNSGYIEDYPAYTVAELGLILSEIDDGNIDVTCFYNWHMGFWDCVISRSNDDGEPKIIESNFEEYTEANVRAAAVIFLLENNLIAADYCNQQLTD